MPSSPAPPQQRGLSLLAQQPAEVRAHQHRRPMHLGLARLHLIAPPREGRRTRCELGTFRPLARHGLQKGRLLQSVRQLQFVRQRGAFALCRGQSAREKQCVALQPRLSALESGFEIPTSDRASFGRLGAAAPGEAAGDSRQSGGAADRWCEAQRVPEFESRKGGTEAQTFQALNRPRKVCQAVEPFRNSPHRLQYAAAVSEAV
mmetsp:Transcript_13145/g.43899  ORF Transcript_13145/g.43899 Transcript_13145/m.43899 type:complete len:204 (+) Transcript_13145:2602-3213(+)